MHSPYHKLVAEYARLLQEGADYPLGNQPPGPLSVIPKDAPRALLFSPHPDDECITGALPLRLLREMKWNVIDVAVTQGSRKDRQAERLQELRNACGYLGFGVLSVGDHGLEKINPQTRQRDKARWTEAVRAVAGILDRHQPRIVFMPHAGDWNTTHIGTHLLVNDALKILPPAFCCWVCETEFWAPMDTPNLMVESSVADLADLVAALSFHVGEIQRNPYHLRLPAWMQDNVRRGGELVGGQGSQPPAFVFATLYRLRKRANGQIEGVDGPGRFVSCDAPLAPVLG